MNIQTGFFYTFAVILVLAALKVITTRNPVHAALYLVLCFLQAAGLWLLLQAEFLALILVLVYVGAVMIFFLFVVMMLNLRPGEAEKITQKRRAWYHFPAAATVGAVLALEMAAILLAGFNGGEEARRALTVEGLSGLSNTQVLGISLYTQYLYPLQIAGSLLLVAIVAAIALTLRGRKDSKHVSPGWQVRAKASERLRWASQLPAWGQGSTAKAVQADTASRAGEGSAFQANSPDSSHSHQQGQALAAQSQTAPLSHTAAHGAGITKESV